MELIGIWIPYYSRRWRVIISIVIILYENGTLSQDIKYFIWASSVLHLFVLNHLSREILFLICVCSCMSLCEQNVLHSQRKLGEGIESPLTGGTGVCEQSVLTPGNQITGLL